MNRFFSRNRSGFASARLVVVLALLLGLMSVLLSGCGGGGDSSPTITTQPVSVSTGVGTSASFSVTAVGTAPLTYQWYQNGTAIAGATSATYTIPSISAANTGNYFVRVTNAKGTATSNTVGLNIPGAPTITTQPASASVNEGSAATFNVVATGTGPLTYQWYLNNTLIPGETSSTLTIPAAAANNSGGYHVVVTNATGTVTSNLATLNVTGTAAGSPTITTQPTSATVTGGTSASFTVAALGSGTLTYQWFRGGVAVAGGNAATLNIPAASAADVGSYYVVVSNGTGSATSSPVTLTVL